MKASFRNFCDELLLHYNRNYKIQYNVGDDLYSEYVKIPQEKQKFWKNEMLLIIENNIDDYIGYAVSLMVRIEGGQDLLMKYLEKYPERNENGFNEIILFALIDSKYIHLKNEIIIIKKVLSTLRVMSKFQFIMRFIYLNESFGLNHLCSMLQNELGDENFLNNYSSHIFQTLQEIDDKLPTLLVACLSKNKYSRAAIIFGALEKNE